MEKRGGVDIVVVVVVLMWREERDRLATAGWTRGGLLGGGLSGRATLGRRRHITRRVSGRGYRGVKLERIGGEGGREGERGREEERGDRRSGVKESCCRVL